MTPPGLGGPTPWAVKRFGAGRAGELWHRVPEAIAAAVQRGRDTQDASQMQTEYAFGSTWSVCFEELVDHLKSIADGPPVKPVGKVYQLVQVNRSVLFPWHYAKRAGISPDSPQVRRLPLLGSELLRRLGPEPRCVQDPLPIFVDADEPLDAGEQREAAAVASVLEQWNPPPEVVIVGFAANPQAGLMHLCWGEAAYAGKGAVEWLKLENLPLPLAHHDRDR